MPESIFSSGLLFVERLLDRESGDEQSDLQDKVKIITNATKQRVEAKPPVSVFAKENAALVFILVVLVLFFLWMFIDVIFNTISLVFG